MSKLGRVYYADPNIDFQHSCCTLYATQGNYDEQPFHVFTPQELREFGKEVARAARKADRQGDFFTEEELDELLKELEK